MNEFQVANRLKREGKLDASIEAYHRAININPNFYCAYHNLAEVMVQKGNLEEAIEMYRRAVELNPNSAFSFFDLGKVLFTKHKLNEAITCYRKALQINSHLEELIEHEDKNVQKVFTIAHRIAEYYSKDPWQAPHKQAEELKKIGYYSEAIIAYRHALSINPDCFESYYNLGELLQSTNQLQEAIAAYKNAIELEPNSALSYYQLGLIFTQQGNIKEAFEYLNFAVQICEALKSGDREVPKWFEKARLERDRLQLEKQIQDIYKNLENNSKQPELYFQIADCFCKQNKHDQAIVFYQLSLQLNPNCAETYFQLGHALKQQEYFEDALSLYRHAIKLCPDFCWYHNSLGDISLAMGNPEEAVAAYRRAIELDSNIHGFHQNLEKALYHQKKLNEIRAYCRQVSDRQRKESRQSNEQPLTMLMVTSYPPYPPKAGGPIRMFEEIKYFGSRHHLTVVSFIFDEADYAIEEQLSNYCDRAIMVMLGARLSPRQPNSPKQVHQWTTWNMWNLLKELQVEIDFDVVLFDFIYVSPYRKLFDNAYTILEEHNIESRILQQCAKQDSQNIEQLAQQVDAVKAYLDAEKEAKLLEEYENRTWPQFDLVTAVSEADRQEIATRAPQSSTLLVENGIDTQNIIPVENRQANKKLLFMGSLAYYPNIDAACYFTEEVMPKIWEQDSEVVFCIAGRDPVETVFNLARNRYKVEVIANPEDMGQVAQECTMTVVPLRVGSGTRIKILHAMAMGLPVVSTSLGCEGLSIQSGEHLVIEDEPQRLSEAVLQVLRDMELQQKLRARSRQLVEKFYDWTSIFSQYEAQLILKAQKKYTFAQTSKEKSI